MHSTDQLSVFDAPVIVDVSLGPPKPEPKATEPVISPGALIAPKLREGYPVPLFPDQVCEVVSIGKSLGQKRFFCVPVKWKARGVPVFPCDPLSVMLLSPAEGGAR